MEGWVRGKGQRKNESKEGRKGGMGRRVGTMKEVHVIVLGLSNVPRRKLPQTVATNFSSKLLMWRNAIS